MELTADNKLKKLIVVGDRVLIKPKKDTEKPVGDDVTTKGLPSPL